RTRPRSAPMRSRSARQRERSRSCSVSEVQRACPFARRPVMKHRIDPEGRRLPIKLDSTSNGEFAPVPLWPANLEANRLAHEFASSFSKRTNLTRRSFLVSTCGAASTLLAFNAANAAAGRSGGFFDLPKDAALDERLARAQVGPAKDEFIRSEEHTSELQSRSDLVC